MEPGSMAFNFVIFFIACGAGTVAVALLVKALLKAHAGHGSHGH